ncbi:hypothetical protein WQE_33991 [Paraburkholderia hospita]|uniref:Uncharacterized protein n=1 Tax=Paraburkholderia hospita TaxID=169430 RepID=A0ABN0FCV1_9BURK|nr:hypothetical protein [Paraburkholderia hospita]EIM96472.1 hypothetical protein WQE_33991 [Paraburkholderia hospita]OUL93533.1 hypothetical protein CA602_00975 [Paraburkholderia hospita]
MSSVFWMVVGAMAIILCIATVLGRAVCQMLPRRLSSAAKFYLSPALGLSILVVFASLLGRHLPMGSLPVRLGLVAIVILAFCVERDRLKAFKHALTVTCFGLVCGSPILGGLFLHGSYFAYNDTFTYLAHSIWLQTHSFADTITASGLTPASSQIALYQAAGLRMGTSYLIALVQAIIGLRWSYEVYPAVIVSAISACCLAAGLPLIRSTRGTPKAVRFALLSLPAFAFNGLTFGSVFGFAPQTLGITFASSLAFLIGYLLRWAVTQRVAVADVVNAAVPGALLFAALTYAYSEMMPFAVLGISASALIVIGCRRRVDRHVVVLGGAFALVALLLLNTEALRAVTAIRTQANVVVGGPVNWSLSGFVAHAVGVHGGAWDGFTWAMRERPKSAGYFIGMAALLLFSALLVLARKAIWRRLQDYSLLPALTIVVLLGAAVLYFRYGVRSPFPSGIGQSWSQFKLSEWASPFASVFLLLAVLNLRMHRSKRFDVTVACVLVGCIAVESITAPLNLRGVYGYFTQYYGAPRSVGKFLEDFRGLTLSTCRPDAPIYLDLHEGDMKARETVTMYLSDRDLRSDWRDDDYLNYFSSHGGKSEPPSAGDCIIANVNAPKYSDRGVVAGPFRVIQSEAQPAQN